MVLWFYDNIWNFIVDKIKCDCCGKYIKFIFCLFFDLCIYLYEIEYVVGVLKLCILYR